MGAEVLEVRAELLARTEGRTLLDVFAATCDEHWHRPALKIKQGEAFATWTWGEYRSEASQVAMALRRHGIDHGDHVALMMTNRPEHVIADVGTLLAGGIPVSVYNTLPADQLRYIADNCGAKVAIVEDAGFLAIWDAVRDQLPQLALVVVLDPSGVELDGREDVVSYETFLARGAEALATGHGELENAWRAVRPDDAVTLIYTSGTTGPPKGVVITHRGLLYQLAVVMDLLEIEGGNRGVSYLPLAHIAERMTTHYVGIRAGGTISFVRDVAEVLPTLLEARPNIFMAVPRVWEKMHTRILARIHETDNERKRALALKAVEVGMAAVRAELDGKRVPVTLKVQHALFDRLVFARIRDGLGLDELRYALSGAAPISAELLTFFQAIGIQILEVYGMTESTAVITANTPGNVRIGTVGTALPGIEVLIAEDGELLARGPIITPGYLNRPEATAEAIDADGWLHTGDLATMASDGTVRIVGRKKELIITAGGKNLSPNNIEETVKQRSPLIGQLCAVGDERPFVAALVVLDAEALPIWAEANGVAITGVEEAATHPAVRAEVQRAIDEGNAMLARVERIKAWEIVPAEWTAASEELTPSLKLKRAVIHRKYAEAIDRLYAEAAARAS
ncbi:MAG: AMP-dependent synthetase/ligase [Nitriliruptoraceae bacterium]